MFFCAFMYKKYFLLYLLIIGNYKVNAQYYSVGYTVGTFTSGLPNLKNQLYKNNNSTYKNFDRKFNFVNISRGFNFEIGLKGDNEMYGFFGWTNKHIIVTGSGKNPLKPNEDLEISYKVRHNQLTLFGIGYMHEEKFGFAIAPVDIGAFKVLVKSSGANSETNWQPGYQESSKLMYGNFGSTLHFDYFFHKHFKARCSWYIDWFGVDLNVQPQYRYKANNISLSLNYVFEPKK